MALPNRSFINIIVATIALLCGTILLSKQCNGQSISAPNRIQIVNAEELIKKKNSTAQKFIGNVVLRHQEIKLFCDSTYLYLDSNSLDAFGHVKILQGDSIAMFGDSLHYSGNIKEAVMNGNVRLTDRDLVLTTTSMTYDLNDSLGKYTNGATITSTQNANVLTSKIGLYYSRNQTIEFRDSVKLDNPQYTMLSDTLSYSTLSEIAYFSGPTFIQSDSNLIYTENGWYDTKSNKASLRENSYLISDGQKLSGDSLFYDRNTGIGEVFRNMEIADSSNNFIIRGHYGWHDELHKKSLITDSLLLIQIFKEDSLFMHGDTALIVEDSIGKQNIHVFHKVKFFKPDFQGAADSIIFNQDGQTIDMYYSPILWSEENQLFADFIRIKTDSNSIESMLLDENTFLISEADTFGYNQVKGRQMIAFFEDQKLNRLEVIGNAKSVYFVGEDGKIPVGMNYAVCSNMTLQVIDNKVEEITFREEPEATLYPMNAINSKLKMLDNFRWEDKNRPKKLKDIY